MLMREKLGTKKQCPVNTLQRFLGASLLRGCTRGTLVSGWWSSQLADVSLIGLTRCSAGVSNVGWTRTLWSAPMKDASLAY